MGSPIISCLAPGLEHQGVFLVLLCHCWLSAAPVDLHHRSLSPDLRDGTLSTFLLLPSVAAKYCFVSKLGTRPFLPPAVADLCFVSEQDPGPGSVSCPFPKGRRHLLLPLPHDQVVWLLPLPPKEDCLCLGSWRGFFHSSQYLMTFALEEKGLGEGEGFCIYDPAGAKHPLYACAADLNLPTFPVLLLVFLMSTLQRPVGENFATECKLPLCWRRPIFYTVT